jgi:competence protein ComEA
MQHRHGLSLLVLLCLALLGVDIGRHVLVDQNVPTFFMENRPAVQIALEGDWEGAGVYQISDGFALRDVIKMTGLEIARSVQAELPEAEPVLTGERYVLQIVDGEITGCSQAWMTAQQRIALGIPLHPDRMTQDDWRSLPGIGERLAAVIEEDRQNNGDYLTLESLRRVKGVGQGKLGRWGGFFLSP